MLKQVPKTDRVKSLVAAAYGDDNVDMEAIAVFEAVAINSLPLRRKGGLFEAARVQRDTMLAMKALLDEGRHIPLQLMHEGGIPVGKVIAADLNETASGPELRTMFYLPTSESELITKLDAGVIGEVSIGILAKSVTCSKCGFNFFSDSATFEHIYERTCDKGHTVGKDGTHVQLNGLDKWMELSLVDQGAAAGAVILPRPRQSLSASAERLAASGFDPGTLALFACAEHAPDAPEKPKNMEEVIQLKAELIVAGKEKEALQAAVDEQKGKLEAATAEVVELKAKLAEAEKSDAAKLKASLDVAAEFIQEAATAALAPLGKAEADLPAELSDRIKLVKEARSKLALTIPVGGASEASNTPKDKTTPANYAAFRARR
jgi:hypothetical protein